MASSLFDDQLTTNIGNLNAHRQPSAHLPSSLSMACHLDGNQPADWQASQHGTDKEPR
jgi:hypothetical protein